MSTERPNVGSADHRPKDDPDAARRRLAARIGGIALHLRHDSNAIAARARAGLFAKFERMADPDGRLTPEARAKKAKLLLRQHMSRLALKSLKKGDRDRPVLRPHLPTGDSTVAPGTSKRSSRRAAD
jgi:hypothetical protein